LEGLTSQKTSAGSPRHCTAEDAAQRDETPRGALGFGATLGTNTMGHCWALVVQIQKATACSCVASVNALGTPLLDLVGSGDSYASMGILPHGSLE
jgi:hypothetical protein